MKLRWLVGFAAAVALLAVLCVAQPARGLTVVLTPAIDTAITGGPIEEALIEDERPTFSFSATRDGAPFPEATFRCSVDNGPAEDCTTPHTLDQLDQGSHTFSVYAEDREHFTADPEPARRSFVVVAEEEEECEAFEDEEGLVEEDEDPECTEEAADSHHPPDECLLRTARARVFTYDSQNRIRLVIRYTSLSPADVNVEYRLAGGRGSLKLGTAHQRFAKQGLFRLSERLSEAEMEKVKAARRFTVLIGVPETPRYCRAYDTRHLTIRRSVHSQVVWFQSDSIFGA